MYVVLSKDCFVELKSTLVYNILIDICSNIYRYVNLQNIKLGDRYNQTLKINGNKIILETVNYDHQIFVEIKSVSLITKFTVKDIYYKPTIVIIGDMQELKCVSFQFGIDLDRAPELVEINKQLLIKSKELEDKRLYEQDKVVALKDIDSTSFSIKLKDISKAIEEII
jgi:hypothetical protein